jgi:hypothetical protein
MTSRRYDATACFCLVFVDVIERGTQTFKAAEKEERSSPLIEILTIHGRLRPLSYATCSGSLFNNDSPYRSSQL